MSDGLPLAAEFPPTTRDDWRRLVEAALKGASFEKRLVSQTYDGLRVEPLYPRAASAPAVAGRPAVPWQVIQRVDHPDAKTANKQALGDLESGATGLSLVFAGSLGAYGYGLDGMKETIATVLDGVYLDAGIALELDLSAQHKDAGQNLAAVLKERGIAPDQTQIRFGYDPLGAKARSGSSPLPWPQIAKLFAEIITDLSERGLRGPFAVADGRNVHAAGGSEAQELAFVVANAVEYLRVFTQAGISLEAARKLIWFRLAADADEFLTIAKLRALRKLWARIEEASGLIPKPAFLSAETAWRMMSTRDPYVNMLRRGELPLHRALTPTAEERLIRELVLQFKLGRISRIYFQRKFGVDVLAHFAEAISRLKAWDALVINGDWLRLTRSGLLEVDRLVHEFFLPQHRTARYA